MTEVIGDYVEFIYCYCKCGKTRNKYVTYKGKIRKDKLAKFISGHNIKKGHKKSEETKKRISKARKGNFMMENSSRWKGDDVGYNALHDWIKRRLPKPDLCQRCYKAPPSDLSNISRNYLRILSDWWWLCRRCHLIFDGNIYNLKYYYQKELESLDKIFSNNAK